MVIYAKGNPHWTTLENHIEDCLQTFTSLSREFPYLPKLSKVGDFWRQLFLCIVFHDLGKVAAGFQASLNGTPWNYRHEILSAGLVPNLNLSQEVKQAVAMAVATSHHGSTYLWRNYTTSTESGQQNWMKKVAEMKVNEDELQKILKRFQYFAKKYFGEHLDELEDIGHAKNCVDILQSYVRPLLAGEIDLTNSAYHILLRGLTIASDHLASAGLKEIRHLHNLHEYILRCDKIRENSLLPFQEKAWKICSSCMLQAPTGSGKTAAALLWASGNQDSGRRVFYVLPYVASINAMQKELQDEYHIPQDDVGVIHHRALYFIYKSFLEKEGENLSPSEAKKMARAVHDQTRKIYRPIKILTPYQLIKPFYGIKGWETVIAEMTGGLFVFDEIHAYEPRTIGLIVRLVEELRKFGSKCLFMSATLPKFLRDLLNESHESSLTLIELNPNEPREEELRLQTRHTPIHIKGEITDNLELIRDELRRGHSMQRNVLIVCNSVRRAQQVYNALKDHARNPKLIHSRFISSDRERIEREIKQADLLVGTQAIEVSLNFSFRTMFSEPAPIDALLQRMGRVNRFGRTPTNVYVFTVGSEADEYIYDKDLVQKTLEHFPSGSPLSNKLAASLVEKVYEEGYQADEQAEYEEAYTAFGDIITQLQIYDESDFKDEFFDLIKAVEATPKKFYHLYRQLVHEERFLDATGLVLPVSLRQWSYLKNKGRVWKEEGHWYIDARYDSELGVILEESEVNDTIF